MHELLVQWVGYVVPWIEAIGIIVVLWGILGALAGLARRGWSVLEQGAAVENLGDIRLAMGEKMVLGLEFFLAGDIILTIVVPTWNSLAILGGIVAVRTVIVYFLNLELSRGVKHDSA
ncbi:MAG: DUF1622 domain-containing protein [Pseudomonadota bacterium]